MGAGALSEIDDPPPFSSDDDGTPESIWIPACGSRPAFEIPSHGDGSLVVVSPHPDDEVLAAGGLMHTLSRRGWHVRVVSVTDGEAAFPGVPGLAAMRVDELRRALGHVAPRAESVRLSLPDGGGAELVASLGDALDELLVGADLILAPWDGDGHPDHRATGLATLDACRRAGRPAPLLYPVWAWHWSDPSAPWFNRAELFALDDHAHRAKLTALDEFSSQRDGRFGPAVIPPWVLRRFTRPFETFVRPVLVASETSPRATRPALGIRGDGASSSGR